MIDEKKLIEDLSKWKDSLEDPQPFGEAGVIIRNVLKTVIDIISDQPTIQPQGIDKDRLIEELIRLKNELNSVNLSPSVSLDYVIKIIGEFR